MTQSLNGQLDFQSQALLLRAERQRVLASNIANADTPGYVAREMDFATALRQATNSVTGELAVTRNGHMATSNTRDVRTELAYAANHQDSVDQNTVDLDRERASFADNAIKYEATLRFINGHLKTMTSAITGQ